MEEYLLKMTSVVYDHNLKGVYNEDKYIPTEEEVVYDHNLKGVYNILNGLQEKYWE
jgi:hypothetical protein